MANEVFADKIKYNVFDNRSGKLLHEVFAYKELTEDEIFELMIDCGHDASEKEFWRIENVA